MGTVTLPAGGVFARCPRRLLTVDAVIRPASILSASLLPSAELVAGLCDVLVPEERL